MRRRENEPDLAVIQDERENFGGEWFRTGAINTTDSDIVANIRIARNARQKGIRHRRKYPPCVRYRSHSFHNNVCPCGYERKVNE